MRSAGRVAHSFVVSALATMLWFADMPSQASARGTYKAEIAPQLGHSQPVNSVALSPDGRFMQSSGCGRARALGRAQWRAEKGDESASSDMRRWAKLLI